ncbi:MAG: GNAT family N-acetyltransferase [Lapillicoccus sp.]
MTSTQWTAEEVVAASNAWVWIPDDAVTKRTDDYIVVHPPAYLSLPTMVRVFGSVRVTEELVDEIEGAARTLGSTRLSWRVSDFTVPADLEAVVMARDGVRKERMDVLAFPLGPEPPDFGIDHGVEVRRVTDRQTVADLLDVTADGFGQGEVAPERHTAVLNEARRGLADDSVGMLVAYIDGEPAGTGGWTLAGPVCRLWGGATHTSFRGRGAYRAVLAERLRITQARGATLGLTHGVVDTSSPILTRLGFQRYGEERVIEQPLE